MKSQMTRNLKRHGSMTPSRNTRRYRLRSVHSSPGRSFLVFDRLGPGHLEPRAYLTDLVDLDVGCHNFDQHTNTLKYEDVEKLIPN